MSTHEIFVISLPLPWLTHSSMLVVEVPLNNLKTDVNDMLACPSLLWDWCRIKKVAPFYSLLLKQSSIIVLEMRYANTSYVLEDIAFYH